MGITASLQLLVRIFFVQRKMPNRAAVFSRLCQFLVSIMTRLVIWISICSSCVKDMSEDMQAKLGVVVCRNSGKI